MRRALIHRVDRHLLTRRVQRRFVISATVQARLQQVGRLSIRRAVSATAGSRRIATTSYGDYVFAVSRLTPLKRFDLVLRALAEPVAAGIRCVIAGEGSELRRR